MAEYIEYHPLKFWLDPASIAEIVAHIQTYLVNNPINSTTEIETIIHDYLIAHPEVIGGVRSINGETGDVVLTADDISAGENVTIKDAINNIIKIIGAKVINNWVYDAYVKTNQTVGTQISINPSPLNGYRYAIIDCKQNDIFTLNLKGASSPRSWAFVDADNILLTQSPSMTQNIDFILIAPPNATKLILNDVSSDGEYSDDSYIGLKFDYKKINNQISQASSDENEINLIFKQQQLSNLTAGNISKNDYTIATDVISLYGEYSFDFSSDYKVYIATFDKNFDCTPNTVGNSTGWVTSGHIGLLAEPNKKYVVEIQKTDGSAITPDEASNVSIKKVKYDCDELVIKNWNQGTTDDEGNIVYTLTRISSDALAFPNYGKFRIKLSSGYAIGIRSGARSINMPSNIYWLNNGDIFEVPNGHNYFRIIMAKYTGTNNPTQQITPDDAKNVICTLRYNKKPSVADGNDKAVKIIDGASLIFNNSGVNDKMPVIAHTSDVHGDITRLERFADFCDDYHVDYGAITGDIVAYNVEDGARFLHDIINTHNTKFGVCIGNHDVRGVITDQGVFDYFMSPMASKIGNTTGKNYYYVDLEDKKLRILSVSLYEEGLVASTQRRNANQHMSTEQLQWICNTLKSTPVGYGIFVMMHTIQSSTPVTEGYTTFYQTPLKYSSAGNSQLGGAPVFDIIDAFVSRSTINKSYNQGGTPSPIYANDDFSNVDRSVEFIAFMVGHFHSDAITYTSTTENKLLVLNVTCTNALYGGETYPYLADVSDLGRNNELQSQDAFNLYAVDRVNKIIRVVRVGANLPYTMIERQFMDIPYITD